MTLLIDPWTFPEPSTPFDDGAAVRTLVLGGGCFWCTEAVYVELAGVTRVRPGYAGDSLAKADYRTVCSGTTNHAEVIEITYQPPMIPLGRLLKLFFAIAHDPTQKNRQGADVGRQYRSVVFYSSEAERLYITQYMAEIAQARLFSAPLATTVEPLEAFYAAEPEHHGYARRNPGSPYIRAVSDPKVAKLRKTHAPLLAPAPTGQRS
ncbi:MAG: peptide-methionine (S)-S-oxide reductase MsrA [Alphaproteobacteria bacterium]|nr:peptide-methionine (S)-S-oxide reductase MsrA [Alphaproteobacteria bacterium]